MTSPASLPQEVRVELERVVRRWQQLPLDHALRASGPVRALAQTLADETAQARGLPRQVLPDLGPATLLHQLQVCTYDAATTPSDEPPRLAERLALVRRAIDA